MENKQQLENKIKCLIIKHVIGLTLDEMQLTGFGSVGVKNVTRRPNVSRC